MRTDAFKALRHGALALALIAGATVLPQAASAGSLHDEGDFGGTFVPIAPSDHYHWRYAGGQYYGSPIYVAPDHVFGPSVYDPDFFGAPIYEEGPGIALIAPEPRIAVDID
jgi:hypothetical protein